MNTKKRGGKRLNAGRKSKYNEPTVGIYFRVPASLEKEIKQRLEIFLTKHKRTAV